MVERADAPPGTWVKVWAQVVDEPAHPEDISVTMFSHSEQYVVAVERERVEVAGVRPVFAIRCDHLGASIHNENQEDVGADTLMVRCTRYDDHPGDHEADDGTTWTRGQTLGHFEEAH